MSNRFRDHLHAARDAAKQSPEVMGLLLNISEPEYLALEAGEVPPDEELLRRLCVLLEWNYYDTRQSLLNELAQDTHGVGARPGGDTPAVGKNDGIAPAGGVRPQTRRKGFHQLLQEEREVAEQTPAVMALLLNISEDEYLALEHGEVAPDDVMLRRICVMLEWNYYDARQLLINDMGAQRQPPPQTVAHSVPPGMADSLSNRLKVVREETGQTLEVLAMLLNISIEQYLELENSGMPPDELLRRISILYNWNYQDLISLMRTEHARTLSPRRVGTPFPGATANVGRLRMLTQELERSFGAAPPALQQTVLAQLELVKQILEAQSALSGGNVSSAFLHPRV